jgi:hypothetical protein
MTAKYIQELKPFDCYKDSDVSNFHYKMTLPEQYTHYFQDELGWDDIFYCYITDWKFILVYFSKDVVIKVTNNKVWNDPKTKIGYIVLSSRKSKNVQFKIGDKEFYYKIKDFGEMEVN